MKLVPNRSKGTLGGSVRSMKKAHYGLLIFECDDAQAESIALILSMFIVHDQGSFRRC